MSMMSQPSFGPRASLMYITVGALMAVWTADYYFAYVRTPATPNPDGNGMANSTWFWLAGLFGTAVVLMAIGLFLGRIGRAARKAELPPSEVAPAEAHIQQTAAAVPNPVVPTGIPAGTPMAAAPVQAVPAAPPGLAPTPR